MSRKTLAQRVTRGLQQRRSTGWPTAGSMSAGRWRRRGSRPVWIHRDRRRPRRHRLPRRRSMCAGWTGLEAGSPPRTGSRASGSTQRPRASHRRGATRWPTRLVRISPPSYGTRTWQTRTISTVRTDDTRDGRVLGGRTSVSGAEPGTGAETIHAGPHRHRCGCRRSAPGGHRPRVRQHGHRPGGRGAACCVV